jgi:protein O-mannosyl-transferase
LLSKPMVVTLPCVLLLMDLWPLNRIQFRSADAARVFEKSSGIKIVLEKMPLFILAALSSVATIYAQKQGQAIVSLETISIGARMSNSLVSYVGYIKKLIFPVNLGVIYPHQRVFSGWELSGAGLMLLVVTWLSVRALKKHSYFPVGWFWFLGTLVPVIGIVQVGSQAMADRYTYVPYIGLFIAIAWGVPDIMKGWRFSGILTRIGAIMILMVLAGLTWRQAGFWKNSQVLFEHTLAVTSANYTAHNNLGSVFYNQGNFDAAISHFRQSIEINPDYDMGHYNLAVMLSQQGDMEGAIRNYSEAIRVHPGFGMAHYNLALLLERKDQNEDSFQHYLTVINLNPEFYRAYNNLGAILMKNGRVNEAINCFQKALKINPGYSKAYFSLGLASYRLENYHQSVRYYEKAIKLDPNFEQARNNLCEALFQGGKFQAAIDCYKHALNLNPGNSTAKENYEKILLFLKK